MNGSKYKFRQLFSPSFFERLQWHSFCGQITVAVLLVSCLAIRSICVVDGSGDDDVGEKWRVQGSML